MNCECNNNSNRVEPRIKHVYGNVLRMAIPLTLRTLVKDGDEMIVNDTDFIPSSDHLVRVVFSKGKTNYPIIATMDGNVAIIEDKGKIPVGTYDISVECYDDLGNPYRFKQNAVLYVADATAEAGIDEEIEYEAQTWYLNAAVFLATTEIGEIGDVIDAKLDDVFGNVLYDANAKEIRFYNKSNSRVLATIDSRPFIVDGTVSDVYIDVSRQVLVVVLNEDAGGRRFSVPLYLVFNSYYKKDEVDSLVSRKVEGVRFDFSQELPLVVPVTKNGSSISSPIDYGTIENAIREDGRLVVACVNNAKYYQLLAYIGMEVAFSRVVALDGYQELLIVNESNVWSMEDVDLGTGGGGGYEPPIGGIPKTDLASDVQTSLGKADTALQSSDLEGYATTDDVDDAVAALVSSAPQTLDTLNELAEALGDDPNFATTMATQLGNKVDKETGKGLSTNDYTTAEKNKLAGLENYDDSALQTAIDGKVDKESGKSLMTDAEHTKLAGIAVGAEVNVQPNWTQTNTSADDYIKNKPTLATVATSGSYNDLQDKPTIPAREIVDQTITQGGTNAVQGGAIYTALQGKANKNGDVGEEFNASHVSIFDHGTGESIDFQALYENNAIQIKIQENIEGGSLRYQFDDSGDTKLIATIDNIPTKVSDLTNDSGFIDKAMYYGESTTAAATMPKVCTVETFQTYTDNGVTHAKEGTIIAVKFTNSDTNTTAAPELNVNGIGAKAIMYNNAIVTSTAKNTTLAGTAKMLAYYRYDPALDEGNGAWEFLAKSVDSNSTYSNASLGQGYGTQTNSSAATAITSSISSYALSSGGIVTIKFTYDVPANATLNINSKGAKAIYNQGAAITAGVIKAGDTATFIYSTYFHLLSVDSWQDKADVDDIPTKVSDLTNDSGFTSNTGTITGITMNGVSKGTSGVVDLGTVITAHQDISGKANASDVYPKTQTYNKDELDAMLDDIEAGDTIVVNSDGANIVDEHDNNSVLFAPSARQMKLMYENVMAIYNGLANTAFTNGKPTLDWVGEKTKYTLSYGTLTGCTADVTAGQVNEGGLRIKLTPTQASYAFTSVTVNNNSVTTTSADDGLGSVYIDIIVNGNITVAATAISGRGIDFTGSTGCSIGAAGVAFNQDLDTTITANEHFMLPQSISVKIGTTNVTHTYTKAQDGKSATLHIDAANITGDLTITCTADEDAHAVLDLTNVGSGITINKANNAHVYVGDTISVLPDSGNKVTASATIGGNAATLTGDTYDGYSYTIGSGDVSSNGTAIAITATADALDAFSIDLTGVTSDVGVTWNTPSAAVSTIIEGSPFSITLAKVSGTGVLNISTSTMGSETLTPNNGTIATDHVTDDITIAAKVAAAPMKVHSYAYPASSDSLGDCLVDSEGGFNLYKYNSTTKSTFTNGGTGNNGNAAFQDGWFGNGKSTFLRKSNSTGDIGVEDDHDFTLIFKGWKLSISGNSVYNNSQNKYLFFDEANASKINEAINSNKRFVIWMRTYDASATSLGGGRPGFPAITYIDSGEKAKVFAASNSNSLGCFLDMSTLAHDVIISYNASTKEATAWVAKEISGNKVLKLTGTVDVPALSIQCIQMPSSSTYIQGLDIYNYAMTEQEAATATNSVIS